MGEEGAFWGKHGNDVNESNVQLTSVDFLVAFDSDAAKADSARLTAFAKQPW